jgi:hypothetical protein
MTRLISSEREKPHPWLMRVRMRLHYGVCIWCKRYHDQLELLGKISKEFPENSQGNARTRLSDEAKIRMKKALLDARKQ